MFKRNKYTILMVILLILLLSLNCAPGNERWDQEINPGDLAGFWAGVWHGAIIVITFIVSLFTKEVGLYEVNNTGWPYNLGFIFGLFISIGGFLRCRGKKKMDKRDWDEIGRKIEDKVHSGIKSWLDESEKEEKKKEWEEVANKIEEKIKKALKEWAEKE